jgi:serine/threonine protein phosphatase PrpC
MNDGTTAVVAIVHAGRVYVANAGDSRAIIVQKGGKAISMSIDHKPNRYVNVARGLFVVSMHCSSLASCQIVCY